MKITLRSIGVIGTLLFGMLFSITFKIPGFVEGIGKEFIQYQIQKKTNEKIEQVKVDNKDSKLGKLAAVLYKKNQQKIDEVKELLKTTIINMADKMMPWHFLIVETVTQKHTHHE